MKRSYVVRKLKKPKVKAKSAKRRSPSAADRQKVREITNGHCHVCGEKLGKSGWQVDHVVPVKRGGGDAQNFLPICKTCNRLRWAHAPDTLRMMLQIGVYAKREVLAGTALGKQLIEMTVRRSNNARERRRSL